MPPRKVQRDYNFAATDFYLAGRKAYAAGELRDDPTSGSSPNNPIAWEQSYKTDPALTADPLAAKYGPVEFHYWFGWDDASVNWPDRTWQASISRGAYRPPINFDGSTRSRLWWLYWLYTSSWKGTVGPTYVPGSISAAETFLTVEEIQYEIDAARKDRAAGTTPPLYGYREPSEAGIKPKGSPTTTTTTTTTTGTPAALDPDSPYAGFDIAAVRRYRPARILPFGGMPFGRNLSDVLPIFFFGRR